jgi:uncharacterized protein
MPKRRWFHHVGMLIGSPVSRTRLVTANPCPSGHTAAVLPSESETESEAEFGIADGSAPLASRMGALEAELRRLQRVVVAFSGGADSSFLAAAATSVLGSDRVHSVTAVSPSLAGDEEADCRALAAELGLRWTPVVTDEMERAAYRLNDTDRCYHCKAELMDVVGPIAAAERATVVLGVNLDDLGDHRPGQRAATEAGAEFPLVTAGFTKADVRAASKAMGLRTWDKPAAACLASRIPYGTQVSVEILGRVDRAEAALHRLGFAQVRVRHYDDTARIEVDLDELPRVLDARDQIVDAVRSAGYRYVTVDLEGFRSGNLNG